MVSEIRTALNSVFGSRVFEVSAPQSVSLPYAVVNILYGNDLQGDGQGLNVIGGVITVDIFTKDSIDKTIQAVNSALLGLQEFIRLRNIRTFAEDDGTKHLVLEYEFIRR
ncbi:MAG: tail completion protein gp17 [Caldisericum sp.]